jgi:hypothetical protein
MSSHSLICSRTAGTDRYCSLIGQGRLHRFGWLALPSGDGVLCALDGVSWARGGLVETALAVCDRAVRQNRRHPSYWLRVLPFLAREEQRAEQGFDVSQCQ